MKNYVPLKLTPECSPESYGIYLKHFLNKQGIPAIINKEIQQNLFEVDWAILVPEQCCHEAEYYQSIYLSGERFLPRIIHLEENPLFKPQEGWTTISISSILLYAKCLEQYLTNHMLTSKQDVVEYNGRKYWITRVSNTTTLAKSVMIRDKFDYTQAPYLNQLEHYEL